MRPGQPWDPPNPLHSEPRTGYSPAKIRTCRFEMVYSCGQVESGIAYLLYLAYQADRRNCLRISDSRTQTSGCYFEQQGVESWPSAAAFRIWMNKSRHNTIAGDERRRYRWYTAKSHMNGGTKTPAKRRRSRRRGPTNHWVTSRKETALTSAFRTGLPP